MQEFKSYRVTEVVPMRAGKNRLAKTGWGPYHFSQHLGAAKDLKHHCHCRMGTHRAGAAALGTCYSSSWEEVAVVTCSGHGLAVATCCCSAEVVEVATCCSSVHELVEATCSDSVHEVVETCCHPAS